MSSSRQARSQDVATMLIQLLETGWEVSAPAKLNLFLEVLGKRADGYHDLETLMITIGLYDTLRFQTADAKQFTLQNQWCGNPQAGIFAADLPTDSRNLIIKAAHLLSQSTGTTEGAQIDVQKRIPWAAGLAGGSSDAAATLAGLNLLWNLKLSQGDLRELGAKLGSDVPFFLADSSAAICRGRGEIIEPIKSASRLHFVVVKPSAGLSTATVFQQSQPAEVPRSCEEMVQSLQWGDSGRTGKCFWNRLGESAARLCSKIEQLQQEFDQLPVLGHVMSGSGTSYFGLCVHRQQALHLAGRLTGLGLGSVFAVQSV